MICIIKKGLKWNQFRFNPLIMLGMTIQELWYEWT